MFSNIFVWLSQRLYPKGRAFRMPETSEELSVYVTEDGSEEYVAEDGTPYVTESSAGITGGISYRVHSAIASVQDTFVQDALNVLDVAIADNSNFTIQDAHDWYRRLGIYDSGSVSLADMITGINQKLNYPGDVIYGRSNYLFIQNQLQSAGFDVYLYPNRFYIGGSWVTQTPDEVLGSPVGRAYLGSFDLGETDLNADLLVDGVSKIANYIEEDKDNAFALTENLKCTFFVCGSTVGSVATVEAARKTEFRQLLLALKPVQAIGFMFINYV